ncbi:MmyB family transcriptional regulator [Actinomadura violacea]|uniref:MmyB family transcriptional regulator n=1 Tax=Actinomadura violacea TaxID=2819934 RepID=UPI0027DB1782|nr:hypothetical protein [Actinomadura violacea]
MGALRLTDAEADHLHLLAGTAPSRGGLHPRDVRPSILALLERLPQTAGFVVSATLEVLAWNDLAALLMEDFAELAPRDRNLARRAFLHPARADATLYGVSDASRVPLRRGAGSPERPRSRVRQGGRVALSTSAVKERAAR